MGVKIKEKAMENKEKVAALVLVGPAVVIAALIVTVPVAMWQAFVAQKLYTWFVVPLNAPPINFWHMWGLLMLITLVWSSGYKQKKRSEIIVHVVSALLVSLMSLIIGWLIKGHI
jgi:hypothetical protein